MKQILKVGVAVLSGAALLSAGAIAGVQLFPVEVTKETVKEVPVIQKEIVTVEKNVSVPGPTVEVEKIVKVDNGNLDIVLNEIYDNDGSVEYLVDDLDDDEVSQIVDRIVFVNDIKSIAVAEVKSELVDEVDGMNVSGVILDDDDISRIKVNDDSDEIVVEDLDFEDKDGTVIVTGTFENDEVKYDYTAEVTIRDNKVEDIDFDVVLS